METTFNKFRKSLSDKWKSSGYAFDADDLDASATPRRWHEEVLIPFAESGGVFTWSTLRSICGNGAWHSLSWYGRNYSGCLPDHCDIKTGKARGRHGEEKLMPDERYAMEEFLPTNAMLTHTDDNAQ